MASNTDLVQYVVDQCADAGEITPPRRCLATTAFIATARYSDLSATTAST